MGFLLGSDSLGRDRRRRHRLRRSCLALIGTVSTIVALDARRHARRVAAMPARLDDVVMRFTELFQTVPSFVLAVVLVAIFTRP